MIMKWQRTELKEKYLSIILSILRHKDEKKFSITSHYMQQTQLELISIRFVSLIK